MEMGHISAFTVIKGKLIKTKKGHWKNEVPLRIHPSKPHCLRKTSNPCRYKKKP